MKKIEKTLTVVVGYEALDGTMFSTEEECKRYENSAECAVRSTMLSIPHVDTCIYGIFDEGNEDDYVRGFYIRNADDVIVINQYAAFGGGSTMVSIDDIGQVVYICFGCEDNFTWMYRLGSEKQIKDIVEQNLNRLRAKLKEKTGC